MTLLLRSAAIAFAASCAFAAPQKGPREAAVTVDFASAAGRIKPMNAVNNGPLAPFGPRQHTTFEAFRDARIPFGRTHDTSEYIVYGGDHAVDISAVFPDFDADENEPANYDFTITDEFLKNMVAAGTKPFFRLGQRIEHSAKRYNVWPPRDFAKWARICEHVIRHYNCGWANGYQWNILYWEIWNEPDLESNGKGNPALPKTWGGTPEQFWDFFETAAKHLKGKFPALKIGGPAVARYSEWSRGFLKAQKERGTPLDFFSWHTYTDDPRKMAEDSMKVRAMLDECGYPDAESILNEWNYVKGWKEDYHHSIVSLGAVRGAAFTAAAMIACQKAPADMLMYYDAMPTAHFNGMFDNTTLEPLRPYYAIENWSRLSALGTEAKTVTEEDDLYAAAAMAEDGRRAIFIARYSTDANRTSMKTVKVRLAGKDRFPREVNGLFTDSARMNTAAAMRPESPRELVLQLQPCSFATVEYRAPPPAASKPFMAATFNIRIDVDKGRNAWTERLPRVAKTIRDGNFDLIGFQEVTKTMWPDLVSGLKEYEFADGPDAPGPNPLAYRTQRFERIASGRFALSEKPDDFKTLTWGSSSVRVCQWALLKEKLGGKNIRAFSMHPDWKSAMQRAKGMALVLGKVREAQKRGERVILFGDMNDMENAFFKWSPFDPEHPLGESIRLAKSVLHDSFDICETPHTGPDCTAHAYTQVKAMRRRHRLDYIFVSDGFRVHTHHTHADRPGGGFPSDHDAVSAMLEICKQ